MNATRTPNTVPRSLTAALLQFCASIAHAEPVFIPSIPFKRAATSFCFENVAQRVDEKGGSIAYGWAIWHLPGLYFEAEHHAVWRNKLGNLIVDYYPAIIDADLHYDAMRSMAGRSRRVAGRGRRLVNLFAGLAVCGSCGARMTFRGKGMKTRADGSLVSEDYLICDNYQRGLGCDASHHFNYPLWESGILDAILWDAMEDRHFTSPEAIRPLEIELAERIRKRAADRERSETALALYVETDRPEVKTLWKGIVEAIDEHDAAIADLRARVAEARGAVSPEEHRRRIAALRDTLDDEDEQLRFETRSRIMEAANELVARIDFNTALYVRITTRGKVVMDLAYEDWGGDQQGITCTKWSAG